PFNKVTDINIKQGPIDQILGLYRISIQTAGMGHRIAEVTFMGLLNTDKPESIIKEQINKIQK
ncbi:MAG: PH domain-containing protein, partial [Candidatus Micrarchaeia archaeon]